MSLNLQSHFSKSTSLRNSMQYHLDNVSVYFKKFVALKSISLVINPGDVYFITGKSGAGKTTLLNLLAGDVKPSKGRLVSGKKGFVGQIFQDLKLLDNYTIEENLWFSYDPSLYNSKNDFYQDMSELCSVLGIKDKLGLKIKSSNGGLKQKVCIIRTLLSKPDIILADEPTAAMDKASAIKVFEVLNYFNSKKATTIIWATHNRDLVKDFPGKIVHLENGKLIYSGHACFI